MRRGLLLGAVALLLAAGCSASADWLEGGQPLEPSPGPIERPLPPLPDLDAVPALDLATHVVGPGDVGYDTFDGSFTTLPEATIHLVRALRDVVRPIYRPTYDDAVTASGWLGDGDRVIGMERDGRAYAYPTKVLSFREIVNETFGDLPAVITYCPLCAAGVVFDRRLDG